MAINPRYRPPKTGAGEMRIPVSFYQFEPDTGPEPRQTKKKILHGCMCEAYNPSIKDLAVMGTNGTKEGVTIRIRDTRGEYLPSNKHFAELDDVRFAGKVFSVIDVRPDMLNDRFVTILLGLES